MGYACFQVRFLINNITLFSAWLFRPFRPKCTLLPEAAKYALGTVSSKIARQSQFLLIHYSIMINIWTRECTKQNSYFHNVKQELPMQ